MRRIKIDDNGNQFLIISLLMLEIDLRQPYRKTLDSCQYSMALSILQIQFNPNYAIGFEERKILAC